MYATYEYYTAVYFGNALTEAEFLEFSVRASSFLDYYTRGKSKRNPDADELKMACCAIAEQYGIVKRVSASSVQGEVQSESVGSWSRTYRSSADLAVEAQNKIVSLARQHLAGSGLLYRGGCCR